MTAFEGSHVEPATHPSIFENARRHTNKFIGSTAALLSALNLMAGAEMADGVNIASNQNGPIPPKVEQVFRQDANLIQGASNCSATFIRAKGKIIGDISAEHCDLISVPAPDIGAKRYVGTNGKQYIVMPGLIHGMQGMSPKLRSVAVFNKVIAPDPSDELSHDLVLYVAKGINPETVYKAYENQSLTQKQLLDLKFGQYVYFSGVPQYQPGNHRALTFQQYNARFIGLGTSYTSNGQRVPVTNLAVPADKDRSEASCGDSGAASFVMVDGQPKFVGEEQSGYDLSGRLYDCNPTHKHTGIVSGAASVDGFAYQISQPGHGSEILNIVSDEGDIPGQESPELVEGEALQQFESSNVAKQYLNGYLQINSPDYEGTGYTGLTLFGGQSVIKDPIFYSDKDLTVIEAAAPDSTSNVEAVVVDNSSLNYLEAYVEPPTTGPSTANTPAPTIPLSQTVGALTYTPDASNNTGGSFTDSLGDVVGQALSSTQTASFYTTAAASTNRYSVSYTNGQLTLTLSEKGGGK